MDLESTIESLDIFDNIYFLTLKNYPNAIITGLSKNTEIFFNISKEKLINTSFKDLIYPNDLSKFQKAISRKTKSSIVIRLKKDSTYHYVLLNFIKIKENEETSKLLIYFIDINNMYSTTILNEKILSFIPVGIFIKKDKDILFLNKSAEKILGYSKKEIINLNNILNIVYPEDRDSIKKHLEEIKSNKVKSKKFNGRIFTKDKKIKWLEITFTSLTFENETLEIYLLEDITKIVKLEDLKSLLSKINKTIIAFHNKNEILNKICFQLKDIQSLKEIWIGKVKGKKIVPFKGCKTRFLNTLSLPKNSPEYKVLEIKDILYIKNIEKANFDEKWKKELLKNNIYSLISIPIFESGKIKYVISIYFYEISPFSKEDLEVFREMSQDISFAIEKLQKERELYFKEYFDVITGLGNKNNLNKDISEFIKKGKNFILALIDIYNFRYINENFGLNFGDEVLKSFANKIDTYLKDEFIYRYGADEFAIISFEKDPFILIDKIFKFIKTHKFKNLKDLPINIAVIRYPEDGTGTDELLIKLERTLQKAKEEGVNNFLVYDENLYKTLKETKRIELLINKSLSENLFEIHLQPIFNKNLKIKSAEVLIRMKDENGNYISPSIFIPIAEETGQIEKIDTYVLYRVKKLLQTWEKKYGKILPLSINATPNYLKQLCKFIEYKQKEEEISFNLSDIEKYKGYLVLELTERNSLEILNAKEQIEKLKKFGFKISLDDFGTGYSSLSYLSQIEVDYIKIDKIFVQDFLHNEKSFKIVEAILNIAKIFNLEVVAEGIEKKEQFEKLSNMGCDYFQGFYLEKPIKLEIFEEKYIKGEKNI